jgi:predicted porin
MNMSKKILPAMIGAALVGGMTNAVADVTAMGHIDTAILYQDQVYADGSSTNLVCTTCSFGFKGSEDLGNGLKAIFLIDFQYDTTERNRVTGGNNANIVDSTLGNITYLKATNVSKGSGSLTDRDQWLGLDSNFGKLRIGTISTVYKSHGAMIDPIYRTVVQGRDIGLQSDLHSGAGESGQGRATNTFRYDSPTFSGFQAGAHYTMQTDTGNSTDSPWGIGGQWQGGGFLVFADYITSDAGGDDDAWKVGGRWGYDKFAIFGQYEGDGGLISNLAGAQVVDSSGNLKGDGQDTWFVGGTATFGNNMLYAAYGQADDSSDANYDSGYDSWNIVGVHMLSKRTEVYAGYAQIGPNENGVDNVDNWTLGMKHTF